MQRKSIQLMHVQCYTFIALPQSLYVHITESIDPQVTRSTSSSSGKQRQQEQQQLIAQDSTFHCHLRGLDLENIEKGDPMAVYKKANEMEMFVGITINNIRVAMVAFTLGLLFSVGTLYIMMTNGIMLGSFTYFFYDKGLLWESSRTIWIHGTIEISVIIIASCAGLVLGNGLLFPKTYTRLESFKKSFKAGLKIMLSTVPFFILAGFIEGFVTRYTQMPDVLAILIISGSMTLIIYYYVYLPIRLTKQKHYENSDTSSI